MRITSLEGASVTKSFVTALMLIMGCYAASSIAADESVKYKNFPLNGSLAAFKKAFPSFQCKDGDVPKTVECFSERETYGELPVTRVEADFSNNALIRVDIKLVSSSEDVERYYGYWSNQLVRKFGKPSKPARPIGTPPDLIVTQWEFLNGSSVLLGKENLKGTFNAPEFNVAVTLVSKDFGRIMLEQFREKSAKRVKDM